MPKTMPDISYSRRLNWYQRILIVLGATTVVIGGLARFSPAAPQEPSRTALLVVVSIGELAPAFALKNTSGKKRALAEFRGRPVILLFFCGCSWCADVAREWGMLQRSGAVSPAGTASEKRGTPVTIIVYTSGVDALKSLAKSSGLDAKQTVFLLDDTSTVSDTLYHAEPCPRVYVLDKAGRIQYVNNGKDDAPREAEATTITLRTLAAVQLLSQERQNHDK